VTPDHTNVARAQEMAMAQDVAAKQFSFRLPEGLVDRVEQCTDELRSAGLEVTRADVVRLLLKHALDETQCKIERLIGTSKKRARVKS
jgi:hypothetical protein